VHLDLLLLSLQASVMSLTTETKWVIRPSGSFIGVMVCSAQYSSPFFLRLTVVDR